MFGVQFLLLFLSALKKAFLTISIFQTICKKKKMDIFIYPAEQHAFIPVRNSRIFWSVNVAEQLTDRYNSGIHPTLTCRAVR